MKRAAVAFGTAMLRLLYHIFSLFPTKDRIVCISREFNTDPVDFLLIKDQVERDRPGWTCVILAKKLESPVDYLPHMFKQVFYIATSRAVVLDSYCIVVSLLNKTIKVPVIQIWHAMGNMKRFGFTALGRDDLRTEDTAKLFHMHEGYDLVLISSMNFAEDFAAGFNVSTDIIREAPLPKADLYLDAGFRAEQKAAVLEEHPQLADKKTIVYAPTFRTESSPEMQKAVQVLCDAVDFDKYNLIIKTHPINTYEYEEPGVIVETKSTPNVLYAADYVITDYSTVMYEAGLLKLPVYLYGYDWDTYKQRQKLYIDLEHDVPTLFSRDPESIAQAIDSDDFDFEAFAEFEAANISVPREMSCTENMVRIIFEMIDDSLSS